MSHPEDCHPVVDSELDCGDDIVCLDDLPDAKSAIEPGTADVKTSEFEGGPSEEEVGPSVDMKETETVNTDKTKPADYKYPTPAQPSFVEEVQKHVATAAPPNFSKQAKPRGRKSKVSQAIAKEVGGDENNDEDGGKPVKPKRKATPSVRAPRTKKTLTTQTKASVAKKGKGKGKGSKAKGSKDSPATRKRGSHNTKDTEKPKKARTSRAIRMSATHPDPIATAQVTNGVPKGVPKDAEPAPPHITSNNVYSNAYRKALAGNGGDTEAARGIAREASALWTKHRMVRSEWTGVFRPPKKN